MSIVKMKRIELVALAEDRDPLLRDLLHAGCVEVREPKDADIAALLHRGVSDLAEVNGDMAELDRAIAVLHQYAPQKKGMFAPRAKLKEAELLDPASRKSALEKAVQINEHAKNIGRLNAAETRLRADQMSLEPWTSCDLPLDMKGTKTVSVLLGTIPAGMDFNEAQGALSEAAEAAEMRLLSEDREQKYLEILVHKTCQDEALEALRGFGFSYAQLKELHGTAKENIRRLDGELQAVSRERQGEIEAVCAFGPDTDELQICLDRVQQSVSTENVKERLLTGGSVLYLEGWCNVPDLPKLQKVIDKYDCAYELADPAEDEIPDVPVKLKNSVFSRCMNVVTEMYSLPAYDGTDPNPLMAPFFILFFGIMMADMGYGLLMMLIPAFLLWKMKPQESGRNFMELILWCGVSTFIVGAMTGGFFGDFIPQLMRIIDPASTFEMPALFTPLDDTMAIMIGSIVLGCIQIVTGMTISVVNKIRSGNFLDALFDEITWWIILAGAGLAIAGIGSVGGVPVVLVVGALMLVFGGTRKAKGLVGKGGCLVGLIYNGVTGFFSDALSYLRLMALMLAGSVIASVFNTLGATFGNVIIFVIISMIGNALNLALNILGCYVHDLRLQCLEYFNRFYKEGGKPYKPYAIQTKYVDVIKEEN